MRSILLYTTTLVFLATMGFLGFVPGAYAVGFDEAWQRFQATHHGAIPKPPVRVEPQEDVIITEAPAAPIVEGPIDSVGNGAIPALSIEPVSGNGITYVNGGISDEEIAELKKTAGAYNMRLMFSAKDGAYVGNVQLQILDAKDQPLVSVSDAGPYFYAQMKPGAYTLETSVKGVSGVKRAKVTVPAHGAFKAQLVY